MSHFYETIVHIGDVLKEQRGIVAFSLAFLFFVGLFGLFFGLFTIPSPWGSFGFYRMEPPVPFDYFYMVFSIIVSALVVTLTFYRVRLPAHNATHSVAGGPVLESGDGASQNTINGNLASSLGIAVGAFGAVCPACLGINVLLLGNVFTAQLAFLIPYIFWIQLGGIALLLVGLYLVAKSSYEKKCIACVVLPAEDVEKSSRPFFEKILAFVALALLVSQVSLAFTDTISVSERKNSVIANGEVIDIGAVIEEVVPSAGFATTVQWGDVVSKMVAADALNPQKLEDILENRYGQEMKPEWLAILAGEDVALSINNDNAVFMMYLLWTLAKHNDNEILLESPLSKYFTNYDIGVGRAGYGDTPLLALTSAQTQAAREVAENAYRPCCGQTTAAPDCSHGFAALGLLQLMASQGFDKEEMFETFVQFNSFWFPETYIKDALYFRITEGKAWNEVDRALIAGADHSSLRGSYKIKQYLAENYGI